jgi:hypothetical protein
MAVLGPFMFIYDLTFTPRCFLSSFLTLFLAWPLTVTRLSRVLDNFAVIGMMGMRTAGRQPFKLAGLRAME